MPMEEQLPDLYKVRHYIANQWKQRSIPSSQLLGVTKDASADDVRSAWKRLAKQYHPDKHAKADAKVAAEAAEMFKQVTFAYSILSDPEKRRRYDMYGSEDLDLEDFDEFAAQVDPHGIGPLQKAMLSLLGRTGTDCALAACCIVTAMHTRSGNALRCAPAQHLH